MEEVLPLLSVRAKQAYDAYHEWVRKNREALTKEHWDAAGPNPVVNDPIVRCQCIHVLEKQFMIHAECGMDRVVVPYTDVPAIQERSVKTKKLYMVHDEDFNHMVRAIQKEWEMQHRDVPIQLYMKNSFLLTLIPPGGGN